MPFKVELSKNTLKNLKRLDQKQIKRLKEAIDEITEDPLQRNVVKLKGYEAFRKRVGNFRIIFTVNFSDSRVFIVDILPRGDAYKNL